MHMASFFGIFYHINPVLCFFVLILLYMCRKAVNVAAISSWPVGPVLRHQAGIIRLQQLAVCEIYEETSDEATSDVLLLPGALQWS